MDSKLDPVKAPFDSDLEIETTAKNGTVIVTGPGGDAPDLVDELDRQAERALVRKFDLRLLPVLAIMYLFNALDKSNLGANPRPRSRSRSRPLAFLLLTFFFSRQCQDGRPRALAGPCPQPVQHHPQRLLRALRSDRALPRYSGQALWPQPRAARHDVLLWLLHPVDHGRPKLRRHHDAALVLGHERVGLLPAGHLLPDNVCPIHVSPSSFFFSCDLPNRFYRRGELARRLAIFYAASNIASAFSGLLAFGVFHIKSTHMANWRYLFVIEGSATVLVSIFAFFYLPASATEATFLTEKEKQLAYHRMAVDSSGIVNEPFVLRDAFRIFREPTSWAILAIEICLGVPLQSVSLFMPQIIARLKYSTVKTNLYTVAPNVSGAVMLLILAFASDYTRLRFPFVVAGFLFTFTGFVIYAAIDVEAQLHVAYFACFMMTWGTSAPSVLLDVLYNNNIVHEGRRVVLTSIGVPVANLMGLVSSNIFQAKDAPRYLPALATTAAFGGTGAVLTLMLGLYMIMDNKRRDREQGVKVKAKDIPTAKLYAGPSSPDFRWFL